MEREPYHGGQGPLLKTSIRTVGFALASEQLRNTELVELGVMAESHGFDVLFSENRCCRW